MFAKFDENGKIEAVSYAETFEDIRPEKIADQFEKIDNFSEQDIWYLIKKDGVVQVDEETKAKNKKKAEDEVLNTKYIPSETASIKVFAKAYLKTNPPQDTEEKLMLSGLYDTFDPNNPKKREVGDLFNAAGQTWETIQAYDENIYPDINPANPQTWHTFNKPLHGKSKETARPFIKPQYGTTDMYLKGECAVFPEGIKRATMDTVFSPEEYAAAWEDVV